MPALSKASWFNAEITLRAAASLHTGGRVGHQGPTDVFLCLVDHFEPQVGGAERRLARERMDDWLLRYPRVAGRHRDADGRHPAHSFFYPYDEYDEWEMSRLAELCEGGRFGEIELHLHHKDDTDATLRRKLRDAVRLYRDHGALSAWPDGRPAWGFIHGNWALDNSRRGAGGCNYCGVDNELTVLAEEGCYADFTFPAWQNPAQPRQVNSIYYAVDDPERPKSYDRGTPARAGRNGEGTLLLVHGPLVPYVRPTARGPRLAMDDGDIAGYRRYTPERLDRWVRAGVHVAGRPDRVFVKLHCHGADDRNRAPMLGGDLDAMFSDAEARYNDGARWRLHYVTAREMFNVIKATEASEPTRRAATSTPDELLAARDCVLPLPEATPAGRPASATCRVGPLVIA